jgi:LPS export ABC transporter protein LptC
MTPKATRYLRFALLGLGLAVTGAVVWTLRQPGPAQGTSGPEAKPVQSTHMGKFRYQQLKEGRERFVIEAESMTGQQQDEVQLEGVTLHFTYMAKGEPGTGTVTSDTASLVTAKQKAQFNGHVRVTTADGFELTTDSLNYNGERGLARTDDPAQFSRKQISGSSKGLLYDSEEGRVVMKSEAYVKVQGQDGKPDTEIRGARAVLLRQEGSLQFLDGATVTQGDDTLKSDRFVLFFDEVDRWITRARAVDSVEIESAGDKPLPGAAPLPEGSGKRRLRAGVFDMVFRQDGSLQEAFGGRDAEVIVEPSAKGPKQRRSMKARTLIFAFDEKGRATEVRGQKDSVLTLEDLGPSPAPPQILSSKDFAARLVPATGDIESAEFTESVSLMQGSQRATSESASYSAKGSRLVFEKDPRLVDEAEGSELVARVIGIRTNGDVTARQGVRHVLGGRSKRGVGFLGGESAVATCDLFQHDAETRSTRYKDGALLRSGRDEVRGQEVKIEEVADGKRRLTATGHVVSVLQPREDRERPAPKGPRSGSPVETRALQMVYDEALSQVHYTGDVTIQQGDIVSRSPEATVHLAGEGNEVKSIVAGEPVEVKQGDRMATGRRGTYTPAQEIMELVGDDVTLKDPTQEVKRGRSLTFHVGDESVVIDGRDEVRPETKILRQGSVKQ